MISGLEKDIIFVLGAGGLDVVHIGRARHPCPVLEREGPSHLTVEFVNVVDGLPMEIWHWIPVPSSWP